MEGISSLLEKECILLDIKEPSMEGIIKILASQLTSVHPEIASTILMKNLISGGFHTICVGYGCAISHTRCPSMDKTLMGAARLSPARDFDASDGQPVNLVFLLVGPQSSASFHLKILSRLARLLHDDQLRLDLLEATTKEQFHQLIYDKEQ